MSATPGPWLTERNQQGGFAVVGINEFTGINQIAVANVWYASDARLIAAAPALADALFALLAALGQHDQPADVIAACEAASAALIESGRVMG